MSRIRSIKPTFFLDEELSELHPEAQLLFIGLWTVADKEGRLEDRPKRIKAAVFPYREVDVEAHLAALDEAGFIHRYDVADKACIAIPGFRKHQRPHPKEMPSELPEPPSREKVRLSREIKRQGVDASRRVPPGREGVSESGKESLFLGGGIAPEAPPPGPVTLGIIPADRVERLPVPPPGGERRETASRRAEDYRLPAPPAQDANGDSLSERMDAAFRLARGGSYDRGKLDLDALARLASKHGDAEVLRRWGIALAWSGYPSCATWAELQAKWNHYAKPQAPPGNGKAPVRAESTQHSTQVGFVDLSKF